MSIIDRINNSLSVLFDTENDPIYRSIICDKDGTIPETINKPTDITIGAMASMIEFLRQLAISLVKQLFINQASEEFLKYQLETFFDSLRFENEDDAEWIQRTIFKIFQAKVSRAAIIYSMRPFSSQEPQINVILTGSAYSDFSYANIYVSGSTEFEGRTYYVLPSITENSGSAYYTFKLTLWDTDLSDLIRIRNILDNIIAAGITYVIEIITT